MLKSLGMVLLELFSGIGGFALGLQDAGMKFKKVYYSEVNKYAIANYKYNFKDAEYVGSVTDVSKWDIERPNIITFGSPCQDFSIAGKRSGLEGDRSSLVQYAIDSITRFRPDVFIWENVKGAFSSNNGNDFWAIIKAFNDIGGYRLEWQLLNTAWFLPQNRERIYLVGHLGNGSGSKVFPIGEVCKNANEAGQSETNETAQCIRASGNDKLKGSHIEIADYRSDEGLRIRKNNLSPSLTSHGNSQGGVPVPYVIADYRNDEGLRIRKDGNSPTIQARAREDVGSGLPFVIGAMRGRNPENPKSRVAGLPTEQMLEINKNDVSNTISTVEKDNLVILSNTGKSVDDMKVANSVTQDAYLTSGARARNKEGKAVLTSMHDRRIRRLTPTECELLQGFPANWTKYGDFDGEVKEISDSQRYKMCGNAVTKHVVQAIGERL